MRMVRSEALSAVVACSPAIVHATSSLQCGVKHDQLRIRCTGDGWCSRRLCSEFAK